MANNPTINVASLLYSAIADALVADSVWNDFIDPSNFERYDKLVGTETPDEGTADDDDYPRATLFGPISGEMDLIGSDQVFATFDGNPDDRPDWIEPGQFTFRLRVISDLYNTTEYTPQTMESINAIRRLGPTFKGLQIGGRPFITAIKVKWKEREGKPENDDQSRIITEIEIAISTEIHGSLLTG